MARRAIFLDRDGVLIENPPNYIQRESDIEYFDWAFDACRLLSEAGFSLFITTNQSLVGRGMMDLADVERLNSVIMGEFREKGANIVQGYICPHAPDEHCDCRKPKPGMLLRAAREWDIDLHESFMVGDAVTDVQAGLAAGVKPLMVRTGRGRPQELLLHQTEGVDALVVDDLLDAARFILSPVTSKAGEST